MQVQFNNAIANDFRRQINSLRNELWWQNSSVGASAEEVFVDFKGPYAELLKQAIDQQISDTARCVTALDELDTQLRQAERRVEEERQRIAAHDAWRARQINRRNDQESFTDYMDYCAFDPEPSPMPVQRPIVSVSFSAVVRNRNATREGAIETSADTDALRNFLSAANDRNRALDSEIQAFLTHSRYFFRECSWVHLDISRLNVGLSNFLQQNEADADWISGVTAAFEAAGSEGDISTITSYMDLALSAVVGAADRYRTAGIYVVRKVPTIPNVKPHSGLHMLPKSTKFQGHTFVYNSDSSLYLPKNMGKLIIVERKLILPRGYTTSGLETLSDPVVYNGQTFVRSERLGLYLNEGLQQEPKVTKVQYELKRIGTKHFLANDVKAPGKKPWAKILGKATIPVGIGLTAWGEYSESYQKNLYRHPEWSESDRKLRASRDGAAVGIVSTAGAAAGAGAAATIYGMMVAGAAVGSVVPGPGTLVGGLVGLGVGLVGGIVGGYLGAEAAKRVLSMTGEY